MEDDVREHIELGVRVLSHCYSFSQVMDRESAIKALRALAETEEEKHMADDELACRVIRRAMDRRLKAEAESA